MYCKLVFISLLDTLGKLYLPLMHLLIPGKESRRVNGSYLLLVNKSVKPLFLGNIIELRLHRLRRVKAPVSVSSWSKLVLKFGVFVIELCSVLGLGFSSNMEHISSRIFD